MADVEQPVAFIIHADGDRSWVSELASALEVLGVRTVSDQSDSGFGEAQSRVPPELGAADAAIMVWSKQSVGLSSLDFLAQHASLRYVGVAIDGVTSEQLPPYFQSLSLLDLSDWQGQPEDDRLRELVEAVVQLAHHGSADATSASGSPVDDPMHFPEAMPRPRQASRGPDLAIPWSELAPDARNAFEFAIGCSTPWRGAPPEVTTERLLIGVLEAERDAPYPSAAAVLERLGITRSDLNNTLKSATSQATFDPTVRDAVPLDDYPRLTANVKEVLALTRDLHTRAGRPGDVSADDLFGGLLRNTRGVAYRTLERLAHNVDAAAFIRGYIEARLANDPPPDSTSQLGGGWNPDFIGDGCRLDDDLGVGTYVGMMATLLASRQTPPPVSIGLFGAWGAGKSTFMGLLEQRIREITVDETAPDIVHIHFNAWTYSDTNLWASLAAEFFEQLAHLADGERDERRRALAKQRQKKLTDDLTKTLQSRSDLETSLQDAKTKTAELTTALQAERHNRRNVESELDGEVAKRLLTDDTTKDLARDSAAMLGLGTKQIDAVVQTSRAVAGAANDLRAFGRVLWARRWTWTFTLLLVLLTGVGASLLASGVLGRVFRASTAGAGVVLVGNIGIVLNRARTGIGALRKIAELSAQGGSDREKELVRAVDTARANEELLQVQLDRTIARAAEIDRQLLELTPGRQLYSWIAERAASDDYRKQLGVLSLVQRDLRQLAILMKDWRLQYDHPTPGAAPVPRPFDRIVLYIDDLDRCTAPKVVEVLQAVQLLLAFNMFNVIVGVDPRWLLQCLTTDYGVLFGTKDDPSGAATPQDYLEKIFQIPFVLPPLSGAGLGRMFKNMAATASDNGASTRSTLAAAAPAADTDGDTIDLTAAEDTDSAVQTDRPQPVPIVAEAGAAALAPKLVESVGLTDDETELLAALGPMIGTPRDAKRLFNIYRLLRSTRDLADTSRFLGHRGEYQAVAQLLGLLTAYPSELGMLMWGTADGSAIIPESLCGTPSASSWDEFVDALEPNPFNSKIRNCVVLDLAPWEEAKWRRLHRDLCRVRHLVSLQDLGPYQYWAPQVARFSFLLSPFALDDSTVTAPTPQPVSN